MEGEVGRNVKAFVGDKLILYFRGEKKKFFSEFRVFRYYLVSCRCFFVYIFVRYVDAGLGVS